MSRDKIYAAAGPVLCLVVVAIVLGMNTNGVSQETTLITAIVLAVIASCIIFWLTKDALNIHETVVALVGPATH